MDRQRRQGPASQALPVEVRGPRSRRAAGVGDPPFRPGRRSDCGKWIVPTPTASSSSTGSPIIPELDLEQQSFEWTTLEDGHEALLVNGGGIDGGSGAYIANAGPDIHVVGLLAPLIKGYVGCIVIRPDGTRVLAHTMPDPLAQPPN